jgi:hypothetical protein
MTQVMSYGVRPPIVRRINFRMVTIIAVFAALVGYPVYTYVKAQHNGGIESVGNGYHVDLKALGNFPFNENTGTLADVPEKFRQLDGKQVTLEGFVYAPNSASDDINSFQFVYNVTKCCFSGPPQVQERVFAVVPEGKTFPNPGMYTMVQISGVMHVAVVKDDGGKISSVYTLNLNGAKLVS